MAFYNGDKLLSKLDLNGEKPEIYVCDGTRTAGKSFYFKEKLLLDYCNNGDKFALITRYQNSASLLPESFIKDLATVKYTGYGTKTSIIGKGKAYGIYLTKEDKTVGHMGYVLPISSVDFIKQNSSLFVDVQQMLFDEFQPVDKKYIPDEVDKVVNIHNSIARGEGKQKRYVPFYFVANALDLYNPYYMRLGVCSRLAPETHYLRGEGWVMEHTINHSARKAIEEGGLNRALMTKDNILNQTGDVYLNTDNLVVKKLPDSCEPFIKIQCKEMNIIIWISNFYSNTMLYVTEEKTNIRNVEKYGVLMEDLNGENEIIPLRTKQFIIKFIRVGKLRYVGGMAKDKFLKIFAYF